MGSQKAHGKDHLHVSMFLNQHCYCMIVNHVCKVCHDWLVSPPATKGLTEHCSFILLQNLLMGGLGLKSVLCNETLIIVSFSRCFVFCLSHKLSVKI